jgi:hypothetical protein
VKPDLHAKTIKLTTMVSWYGTSCGLDVKKIKRLRRFPGLIRVVHVPDGKNSKHSFPKPVGIRWPRDMTVTELLVFFDRNAPKIEIFMVVPPFFCHYTTWRVGPAWGVRRARIVWEKFSIVFAPYSIDNVIDFTIQYISISRWSRIIMRNMLDYIRTCMCQLYLTQTLSGVVTTDCFRDRELVLVYK